MKYEYNTSEWQGVFAVPNCVADQHIKFAPHSALKVMLYLMRNGTQIENDLVCKGTGLSLVELEEALTYWKSAGLLKDNSKETVENNESKTKRHVIAREKRASRVEVAMRAYESKEIALVLNQAEMKFGRPLKEIEKSSLVYILDNLSMNPEIVLMLLEHAVAEGRTTSSFLESTAVDWINRSIDTVALAEQEMTKAEERKQSWSIVRRAAGIDSRRPSQKEADYCYRWVNEWCFDEKMLRLAYDHCVDSIGKMTFPYMDKILNGWHSSGIKTPDAVAQADQKHLESKSDENQPSLDLSLF